MEKELYKTISDVWLLIKKYIPKATSNDEVVWDMLWRDSNEIYDSTRNKPDYYREMTSKFIRGALDLLEGIRKEANQ